MYICTSSWENPKYSGNSLALVYFGYRIQQGPLLVDEYPKYLLDSGLERLQTLTMKGISQILGLIAQISSEMAKFAIPAQEIPEFLG